MNITITARKTTVRDSFKERVEKKLAKFDRFFDEDANAIVKVTNEKDRETVEITIQSQGMIFRSEKTTSDRMDSLEAVTDALFTQIVKNKNKLVKKLRDSAFDSLAPEELHPEEGDYQVIRSKKFSMKPMSVDEAILQMNMLEHEFYVFRNDDTHEINVVYKRNTGDYGLIEPAER